jgi:hypothetical protein
MHYILISLHCCVYSIYISVLHVSIPYNHPYLGDPGVDGKIILKWIFKKWGGGMDWIELAQDRDRWWALLNAVMNLWVP